MSRIVPIHVNIQRHIHRHVKSSMSLCSWSNMHKLARVKCMCKHTCITRAIQDLPASESYRRIRGSLVPHRETSALVKESPYCYEFENGGSDERRTCTLQIISFCRGTKTEGNTHNCGEVGERIKFHRSNSSQFPGHDSRNSMLQHVDRFRDAFMERAINGRH